MKRMFLGMVVVAVLTGGAAPGGRAATATGQQQKTRVLNQVNASRPTPIYGDNSTGSRLYIQEAGVKEISGNDFTALVGEAPMYYRQATFPEVTLLNTTGKTIKAFVLVVKSAQDKTHAYVLYSKNLSITAGSTHKVASGDWPQVEKITVQKAGKFINVVQKPGLTSARSWISGAASDLKVFVGLVEFEDGSTWQLPSNY